MRKAIVMTGLAFALCVAPLAMADDAVGDPYTLNYCAVSGEPLGSAGDPLMTVYKGRQIRFCCPSCEPQFKANPSKFLADVDAKMIAEQDKYYPVETCVVSGKPIGENAVTMVIANREMKFCCNNCPKTAAADPAKFIAKLDEAVIAKQSENYALKTCPVSGEELGAMGEPVNVVLANRLIKLCCSGCEKQLAKVPAKYLAALDGKEIEEGSEAKEE